MNDRRIKGIYIGMRDGLYRIFLPFKQVWEAKHAVFKELELPYTSKYEEYVDLDVHTQGSPLDHKNRNSAIERIAMTPIPKQRYEKSQTMTGFIITKELIVM